MQPFFLIQASNGRAFRVVRRGFHMVVEQRVKAETAWDPIYKLVVGQEVNAEATALVGAIRKALFFADDLSQIGFVLALLKDAPASGNGNGASFLSYLPRDRKLNARVPAVLKETLKQETKDLSEKLNLKLTLTDYLIRKLGDS